MKYRIKAWGSQDLPDLDYEADYVRSDLSWKYPVVQIQRLEPMSREQLQQHLDGKPGQLK